MHYDSACAAVEKMIRALTSQEGNESVRLLVDPRLRGDEHLATVLDLVDTRPCPYWDIWLRDTGPLFVEKAGKQLAVSFRFNGWGGKFLHAEDPDVGWRIAEAAGREVQEWDWVLEGGAIDCNGAGCALATRHSLLNPNRNPGRDQESLEAVLRESLGIECVLWLDRGLANDHTDSHVDNIARFVARQHVVCMRADNPSDPNYAVLERIYETLCSARIGQGNLEVTTLPCPRVSDHAGAPLPASYCNFYIANQSVIVPVYGDPRDEEALHVLQKLFPGRTVVGIGAYSLLAGGGGAFHCISQQQPEVP